jgi:hypothetical protein
LQKANKKANNFSVLPALCTLWLDRRPLDQLSRLDFEHRGKLFHDFQARVERALLQLAEITGEGTLSTPPKELIGVI